MDTLFREVQTKYFTKIKGVRVPIKQVFAYEGDIAKQSIKGLLTGEQLLSKYYYSQTYTQPSISVAPYLFGKGNYAAPKEFDPLKSIPKSKIKNQFKEELKILKSSSNVKIKDYSPILLKSSITKKIMSSNLKSVLSSRVVTSSVSIIKGSSRSVTSSTSRISPISRIPRSLSSSISSPKSSIFITSIPKTPGVPSLVPPTTPPIKTPPIVPIKLKGIIKSKKKKKKFKEGNIYVEDFTSKALGLDPIELNIKQTKALLKKVLTGLEIRRRVVVSPTKKRKKRRSK